MKNKRNSALAVIVVALVAGYNVYSSQKTITLSDLALSNVEALAAKEGSMCETGCLSNGDGCMCHTWYPNFKTA